MARCWNRLKSQSTLNKGTQAQDLQIAGQRLGRASDSLFAIYEPHARAANDIRVQDANNQYIDDPAHRP